MPRLLREDQERAKENLEKDREKLRQLSAVLIEREVIEGSELRKYLDFFFFQAEDGIRDPLVTGVQTCALPISTRSRRSFSTSCSSTPRCRRPSVTTLSPSLTASRVRYRYSSSSAST